MDIRELGRMTLYLTLGSLVTNEAPLGYLYLSTSSTDGRDLFDPTAIIAHLEYSLQISKIFTSPHKCEIVYKIVGHYGTL